MQLSTMLRSVVMAMVVAAVLAGTCCTSIQNSAPPSQVTDLTGTWRGSFSVQGIASDMVWTLTQSGSSVTGPVLVRLPNGIVLLNGFLTGTLTGQTLTYTISVGPQGIPTQPTCAGQLAGTMTAQTQVAATSTLTGNYALSSTTCTPPFAPSGDIALSRG